MENKSSKKIIIAGKEIGDWSALLALVISILTLIWSGYEKIFAQPKPGLIPPQTINFQCSNDIHCDSLVDHLYIRATPLTFVNSASKGHTYTVTKVQVDSLFIDKLDNVRKDISYPWFYFSKATSQGISREPIYYYLVDGGQAIPKEIEFWPVRKVVDRNGRIEFEKLLWSEFNELIVKEKISRIDLTFRVSTMFPKKVFSASCTIIVDSDFRKNAELKKYKLFSRECFYDEAEI